MQQPTRWNWKQYHEHHMNRQQTVRLQGEWLISRDIRMKHSMKRRVGRQQSNRVVAELVAATLPVQGFQLNFLYAPSSLNFLIVIFKLLLLSMGLFKLSFLLQLDAMGNLGRELMSYIYKGWYSDTQIAYVTILLAVYAPAPLYFIPIVRVNYIHTTAYSSQKSDDP